MFSGFLAPNNLAASPAPISRVLLIGGCIFDGWHEVIGRVTPDTRVDHRLLSHVVGTGADLGSFDLCLVQVPLRSAIPEFTTMRLSYADIAAHEALFRRAVDYIRSHVELIRLLPSGPPTFVLNYMPPQQNPLGRLLPRYDLRNPVHFIEELNRALYDIVAAIPNSHVLDIAQIGASVGRQRFQDDPFFLTAHGGFVADYDFQFDEERLEPQQPLTSRFDFAIELATESFWNEALAMYRTLRGVDRVKVLCVDLDDTLWRGVPAEQEDVDPVAMEGWPLGLAEALTVLRQRGVVLAIISKNDESRVREIWPQLFSGKLMLEDFSIRKIGWRPKPEAMAEVIAEANVLPESVVFLDDNPVERALMKSVHPLVRVIESPHADWRRILLWSSEMQVDVITEESTSRNVMIQAQVERESDRLKLGQEEFLRSLDLRVEFNRIDRAEGPQFQRALELVNKTNQFNTTGRRWTADEFTTFLFGGGQWITFKVADRYTNYGLVGVVAIAAGEICQFVMSCRVFDLGVELAVLATLSRAMALKARVIETPRNGPCQLVFKEAGWRFDGHNCLSRGLESLVPAHITVVRPPPY